MKNLKGAIKDWVLTTSEVYELYDICRRCGLVPADYYTSSPEEDWGVVNAYLAKMRKTPSMLNAILSNARAVRNISNIIESE